MDKFQFEKNTVDPKQLWVENVIDDNACCYRALANGLFHRSFYSTTEDILEHKEEWNLFKEDTMEDDEWGFWGDEQDKMAKYIQQEIVKFIDKHQDTKLDTFSDKFAPYDMTFSELIMMTHGLNITEYIALYSMFAGEEAFITTEFGDIEMADDRWGGLPEQIAFSFRFKVPIIVYACQKYSDRYKKIIAGRIRNNKAEKGVRYMVSQCIGVEFLKTTPPILLLWKKSVKGDHYMALYQKYANQVFQQDGTIVSE